MERESRNLNLRQGCILFPLWVIWSWEGLLLTARSAFLSSQGGTDIPCILYTALRSSFNANAIAPQYKRAKDTHSVENLDRLICNYCTSAWKAGRTGFCSPWCYPVSPRQGLQCQYFSPKFNGKREGRAGAGVSRGLSLRSCFQHHTHKLVQEKETAGKPRYQVFRQLILKQAPKGISLINILDQMKR